MPLVKLLVDDYFTAMPMSVLSEVVRNAVAEALTCEGGALDPDEDIEVVATKASKDRGDWTPCDISVSIEAMAYPSRLANEDERAEQIREAIKADLPDMKIGVWLDLKPAVWTSG